MSEMSPAPGVSHRLGLFDLEDQDLISLRDCTESLGYSLPLNRLFSMIGNGELMAYRLSPGFLLLQLCERGEDSELNVFWLQGKNMFRQLKSIGQAARLIADENGCKRLTAMVHDERWAKKLIKSFNGKLEGFLVSVEV